MNLLNIEEKYKQTIESIWNDKNYQSIPFIERGYAVQGAIEHDSLLFIGINPSLENKNNPSPKRFFYIPENDLKIHKYFKKFPLIAKETKQKWSHLDLLYLRETKQENIKAICENVLTFPFIKKQLEISKEIIEGCKPKIIVVCNAYARDLFNKPYFFKTFFDENLGTYRITDNTHLNDTPVFFSGMITGQRSLDNGSLERLIWHIRFVLEKLNK